MIKKIILLFLFLLVSCVTIEAQNPTVVITDQNSNTGTVNIDCDYSFVPPKTVRLTATYPTLNTTTNYTVASTTYNPIGNFNEGAPITIMGDDKWSSNIPIGFNFCFYGNQFTTVNVGDNGVVRFGYNSSVVESTVANITNTVPSPSLIRNAIFGGYQDMVVTPGSFGCITPDNCGIISSYTTGVAPFRKFIVNYYRVNHFNCSNTASPVNNTKSTFQIILNETTNIIEINVKSKPTTCFNSSSNGNVNSLIGLNNATGTLGIAPTTPIRNTSAWSATDESYVFTPSGISATTIQWYNAAGTFLGSNNPIDVIPTVNTSYNVLVNYNTCTPLQITDNINVVFDLDYPVAPNIVANFCDEIAPFYDQIVDVASLLTPEAGRVKEIFNTSAEANIGSPIATPLSGMDVYQMTTPTKVFYYRVTQGACYSVASITLNLFITPDIIDQEISVCDPDNSGTETIALNNALAATLVGYNPSYNYSYFQNEANSLGNSNPFSSITVVEPPGFYDVFIRVANPLNLNCWSVTKLTIKISPKLELTPIATFCIEDPNFDGIVTTDLTSIAITNSNIPVVVPNYTFYTSLSNAQNQSNPILNPTNHNISIQNPAVNATLYVVANLTGYCTTIQPIVITICEAEGGDNGGGIGGNGGFGGFGACLEIGDPVPAFDLNLVFNAVLAPAVGTSINFYPTLLGAQTQDGSELSIVDVANFFPTVSPITPIWVRYTDALGVVGIKRIIIPLKYKKHDSLEVFICDTYNDGSELIQLASYIAVIQAENLGETITAYATQQDFDDNTNPITAINIFSPSGIVYIKMASYGCNSTYDLKFILELFPENPPILKQVCDVNADGSEFYNLSLIPITDFGVFTTPVVTYHSTSNGSFNETNIIFNTTSFFVTPTTNVWVRIEDGTNCPTIQQLNFGFFGSIAINVVPAVEVCDTDGDAIVNLNLTSTISSIISTSNVDPISYLLYTNQAAALTHLPSSPFEILDISNFDYNSTILGTNATIWMYLLNGTTGCDRVVPINLIMKSFPLSTNPTVQICDFENNGTEVIPNMQVFNPQISSTYFLYNFAYFLTEANANAGTPALAPNEVISSGQVVYVSISNGSVVGCSRIVPITIQFKTAPTVTDYTATICDNLGNGQEAVNFNSYNSNLVSTITGLSFTYFQTQNNAFINSNQISASYTIPSFDASGLSTSIFVRVTDNSTGCFSIAELKFQRRPLIEAYDTIAYSCDISLDNDLKGLFNLPSLIPRTNIGGVLLGMILNPSNYTISYYSSSSSANSGTGVQITTPVTYIVNAQQTSYVYIRFVDNVTGCFTVKTIELQIYNLPKFVNSSYEFCDTNLDGIYTLNLNVLNGVVVENPLPYIFQYYLSYDDAFNNQNEILNFSNYTVTFPLSIFVKGTNVNGCNKIKEVVLIHLPDVPILQPIVSLLQCDTNSDSIETFNLTNAEVQLNITTPALTFTYFRTLAELQTNNPAN